MINPQINFASRIKMPRVIRKIPIILTFIFAASNAFAVEGAIELKSQLSFAQSIATLKSTLESKGMTIFAIVDHTKGAQSVDIDLLPTTLFIFGNPKAGSPLMRCTQSVALDLPQKMLISENVNGEVNITYNDPTYLAKRHALNGCDKNILGIKKALNNFAEKAAGITQ